MSQEASPIFVANSNQQHHVDEARVMHLVEQVCRQEQATIQELNIILSDHPTVLALNKTYLAHNYETDVLSFPLNDPQDPSIVDGEIYVDLDTAYERCGEFNVPFEVEAYRYIIHGLLHLLGYTDETKALKEQMRIKEDYYLAGVTKS